MKLISSFAVGLLFAVGLGMAGMTRPSKVVGFLDIAGAWDPSLMFVMVGGIGVYATFYRLLIKRNAPLLDDKFHVPKPSPLDRRLLLGAALFGIGWGLGGYCPGPGLVSLAHGAATAYGFVGSMLVAMILYGFLEKKRSSGPR